MEETAAISFSILLNDEAITQHILSPKDKSNITCVSLLKQINLRLGILFFFVVGRERGGKHESWWTG